MKPWIPSPAPPKWGWGFWYCFFILQWLPIVLMMKTLVSKVAWGALQVQPSLASPWALP